MEEWIAGVMDVLENQLFQDATTPAINLAIPFNSSPQHNTDRNTGSSRCLCKS